MDVQGIADSTDNLIQHLALVIEIAHYMLVTYGVRCDWDQKKARQQPVATWLMSVACCFGGGMLLSIAVGKPALTPLKNNQSVLLMTIVWWNVFYSPMDVIFSLLSWKPALLVVAILKEMIRTRKIIKGVKMSRAVFPESLLLCTVLGMLGACGGGFVKNAAAYIRNKWDQNSVKNLYFSTVTKLCLLFSLLYNLQISGDLPITFNTVVLLQFVTMSLFTVGSKVGINVDPFHPVEKVLTSLAVDYSAFGGEKVEEKPTKKPKTGKETHEKKE